MGCPYCASITKKKFKRLPYQIKTSLMYYLSIKRSYRCSTEVVTDYGRADILAFNGKRIMEVEIKISEEDLIGDIKKYKHSLFASPGKHYKRIPNYLYYCVPTYLLDFTKKYLKDTPYGIIHYDSNNIKLEKIYKGKDGYYYEPGKGRKEEIRLVDDSIGEVKRAKNMSKWYSLKMEGYVMDSLASKVFNDSNETHYQGYKDQLTEVYKLKGEWDNL